MSRTRFALFGAGFWARYQLAAWKELPDADCVALFSLSRTQAESVAREFEVPAVYDDPAKLLRDERVDFIDVVTHPASLQAMVKLAAAHRVPAISQKPMAPSLRIAEENLQAARDANIPYLVHENWRWQGHLREVKRLLAAGTIGHPFRARITMVSGYPVFTNEPQIRELEEFILTDMGTHLLDLARFYFGEARSLYCQTKRVQAQNRGEDVATVMLEMGGTTVTCEMGYPENFIEHECFPQTLVFIEGERGSIEVAPDYWVRVTTREGTRANRCPPRRYAWADPDYAAVHASIVACHANLLGALRGTNRAETTAEDNYRTLRLVYSSYESAREQRAVHFA